MKHLIQTTALAALLLTAACAERETVEEPVASAAQAEAPVEATSFLGEPLVRRPAGEAQAAALADEIADFEARAEHTEDDFVALGGRYAAAGRYGEAIAIYSDGIELYPGSYKLRRHRAHRFLTTRKIEEAHADLIKAQSLIDHEAAPVVEYRLNGDANGAYQHWILYHLGVTRYLSGDYTQASEIFAACLDTATSNDMRIGAVDWQYLSLLRDGKPEAAEAALELISADIDADETKPYFKRVMLYKGARQLDQVLDLAKPAEDWSARDVTVGYGAAVWLESRDESETARNLRQIILASPYWNIWAYLVAEKDAQ